MVICALPLIAVGIFLAMDIDPGDEKRLISLLGVVVFMLFGFLFSKYPGHVSWKFFLLTMKPDMRGHACEYSLNILNFKSCLYTQYFLFLD